MISQFLIEAVCFGFEVRDSPALCHYRSEASSIVGRRIIYGMGSMKILFQFILQKLHLMEFNLFESQNKHSYLYQNLGYHPAKNRLPMIVYLYLSGIGACLVENGPNY